MRAVFSGAVAALAFTSALLSVGCGSIRDDQPLPAGGGTGGAADAAGSDGRAGRDVGGNASGGRSGSTGNGGAVGTSGSAGALGGATSAGAGGTGSDFPVDTRPPRPTWKPPFTLGAAGWRDSTVPLCEKPQGDQFAFDVWADSRGVFGLFATACNILAGTACGKQGTALQFNDGTGWRSLYTVPPGPGMGSPGDTFLSGFDSGALLLAGFLPDQLAIWRITAEGQVTLDASFVSTKPFTLGTDLAYALGYAELGQPTLPDTLLRFIDGEWSKYLTLPAPAQGLWADKDRIVIVGPDQAVYEKRTEDADFVAIPGAPAGDYAAVWGFGPNDIWLGNQAGQLLHYNASKWEVIETGSTNASGQGILQLWGSSDGQLYFRTINGMGRYNGTQVELLFDVSAEDDHHGPRVITGGMWGLSSSEVFLSVTDWKFDQYECGGQFMLFFDGTRFHSF